MEYPLFNAGNELYSQAQLNKIYNVKGLEFLASAKNVMTNPHAYAPLYTPNEATKKHQTLEMGVINDLPKAPALLEVDNVEPTSADWDELYKPSRIPRRMNLNQLPAEIVASMENAFEREMAMQNTMLEAFDIAKEEKVLNDMAGLRERGYTESEIMDIIKKKRADEAMTMMKAGTLRIGTPLDAPMRSEEQTLPLRFDKYEQEMAPALIDSRIDSFVADIVAKKPKNDEEVARLFGEVAKQTPMGQHITIPMVKDYMKRKYPGVETTKGFKGLSKEETLKLLVRQAFSRGGSA